MKCLTVFAKINDRDILFNRLTGTLICLDLGLQLGFVLTVLKLVSAPFDECTTLFSVGFLRGHQTCGEVLASSVTVLRSFRATPLLVRKAL